MKILGYNFEKVKNIAIPPKEIKISRFTIVPGGTEIVAAEIKEYKQAIKSATSVYSQARTKLYDIYQNALDYDSHLKGLLELRLLNTTGKGLVYMINDKVSDKTAAILESPKFTKLIEDLLMVKFWGFGLFEFDTVEYKKTKYLSYTKIPIKHVDPFKKVVRKMQGSVSKEDQSYDNLPNIAFIGDADSLGILQQLALLAIYKRAALGDWAQYSQLAGTNFRTIKYRGALPDAASRSAIRDIVNNAGSGTLDVPNDMDIETANQTSSSQNQLFENYIKYLDDEMAKLILGQTMTTSDGSSRSQAEVHERTQDDIFDSDAKYILDVFNYELYDIMLMLGLPEGGRWQFVENTTSNQIEEIEKDLKLKDLITINPVYFYEKYNVPPPEERASSNLASVLGVGASVSLQAILVDTHLTPERKKNALMIIFGIDEDSARKLVDI